MQKQANDYKSTIYIVLWESYEIYDYCEILFLKIAFQEFFL
jgi:hypothetical protein